MKIFLAIIVVLFVIALIANGPILLFSWFMSMRIFFAILFAFGAGFLLGRFKR